MLRMSATAGFRARDEEGRMKTIVVGYDETEPARRALERAADLATAFGSKVIVTSVAPVMAGFGSREMGGVDPADPPEEQQQELEHAKEFLTGRGIDGEYRMSVGDPADAIVELADQVGADLIVVGTRHLGLVQSVLGLSVSGAVKRKAHCDVLTVQ
jgi:nucleotide-binding universal stress UspA family protein